MHNQPPSPRLHRTAIVGVILAGGQSLRMGQDKSSVIWQGRTLRDWVQQRLAPQVENVLISLPFDSTPATSADTTLFDQTPNLGPLGGIQAALRWLQQKRPQTPWLLSCSCDAPLLPLDLAQRLAAAAETGGHEVVYAHCLERAHYTHALWSCQLLTAISAYLATGGRSLHGFFAQCNTGFVEYKPATGLDPFINLNTPEDLHKLPPYTENPS